MTLLKPVATRRIFFLFLVQSLLWLGGCATYTVKTAEFREKYNSADFAAAEKLVDERIASETGTSIETVSRSKALAPEIDPGKGDALLYLLDKGMLRFARNDPENAISLFRKARTSFDEKFISSSGDFLREIASVFLDDTVRTYRGADYEHITLRAMLAMADLATQGGDAFAYTVQLGEMQEDIIGSLYGETIHNGVKTGYRPREHYRRVALGAYLQGIIREDTLDLDEAAIAFKRAIEFSGNNNTLYSAALERVQGKNAVQSAHGALHVFYFGGRGPNLIESSDTPTELSIRLAGVMAFAMSKKYSFLAQAPVPIPRVKVNEPFVPPLSVRVGNAAAMTETVLDVNHIASEQLKANMPWIIARAVLRRATKASAAAAAGDAVRRSSRNNLAGALISIGTNLIITSLESADTRSWLTLPATIQALRLDLPAGEHTVQLNSTGTASVRISPGRNSYIFVFQPALNVAPSVVVDRYSVGSVN